MIPITQQEIYTLKALTDRQKAGDQLSEREQRTAIILGRRFLRWKNEQDGTPDKNLADRKRIRAARFADRTVIIPLPANPRRRAKAKLSLLYHLKTYQAETFTDPFSDDQKTAILIIQNAVLYGSHYAFGMPRGGGKTTISEGAIIWMVLHGHKYFPVIVGSTADAAKLILDSIKTEIETNDLLAEDFPEICLCVRELEGNNQRCKGQLARLESDKQEDAERTAIEWGGEKIVMPTVKGSANSGAVIQGFGITSAIRGLKHKRQDRTNIRPDFALCDDPQTDESAKSPQQVADRERLIMGTVLRLAGPKKKLAAVMPCTIIRKNDLSDRFTDLKRHPDWQGRIMKMVYSWPLALDMWEKYAALRRQGMADGDNGKAATDYYKANRAEMDKGGKVSWESRKFPGELSAIQHAWNLRIDSGDEIFNAECQGEPSDEVALSNLPTVPELCTRLNRVPFGIVPAWATMLTAFVDVGSTSGFHWAVCAWRQGFAGSAVAWGREDVPQSDDVSAAVYAAGEKIVNDLCGHEWKTENGTAMRLTRCPLDSGWGEQANTVYELCRQSQHAALICPSKGESSKRGYITYKAGPGVFTGDHLRVSPLSIGKGNIRLMLYDANYWKSFLFARLMAGMGSQSAVTFNGRKEGDVEPIATHLTSEYRTKMKNVEKGIEFDLWGQRPNRFDNHWLDCLVGCCVAASVSGLTLQTGGGKAPETAGAPIRQRIKASYEE